MVLEKELGILYPDWQASGKESDTGLIAWASETWSPKLSDTLAPIMPCLLIVSLPKGLWGQFSFKPLQAPWWNVRHFETLLMQRSLKNSHEFAWVSFSLWWILFLLFIYRILSEECSPVNFLHMCVSLSVQESMIPQILLITAWNIAWSHTILLMKIPKELIWGYLFDCVLFN